MVDRRDELGETDELNRIALDSAFIFDFETAQILAQIFYLKHCWIVTDFIEKELKTPNMPMLKQMGLGVVTLTGDQVRDIYALAKSYVEPSVPDLSCLVYAKDNGIPLVTRDSALRRAARKEGVHVLDTHDVIVELVAQKIIAPHEAADALEAVQNQRLLRPRGDWTALIRMWRKQPPSDE